MILRKLLGKTEPKFALRKDKRPVINPDFLAKIGYRIHVARFGDWVGFSEQMGQGIIFHNLFTEENSFLNRLDKVQPLLYCVNLMDSETLNHVVIVDRDKVQVWKQSQLEKTIPLPIAGYVKKPVKLDSEHILGVIQYTPNGQSKSLFYSVNINTGYVVSQELPDCENITVLPSQDNPDDEKQNCFAVTTLEKIQVYQRVDQKVENKDQPTERFQWIKTLECPQGGELFPSPDGKYWITSGRPLELESPKLWKVSADYQLTLIGNIGSTNPICWFAGHIFYSFQASLYATHPETLTTYCLFDDTASYVSLGNQLIKYSRYQGKVVNMEFLMDQNLFEDQDLIRTVAESTHMPLTVTRVACHYLLYPTRNTQVFFPSCKKIFEPQIPRGLPPDLQQKERQSQWQKRWKGH